MRQAGEPSVEEILESIKKVIARDNRETAAAERRRREHAGVPEDEDDDESDVLELGEAAELVDEGAAAPSPLVTGDAQRAMRESLAALAMLAEPGQKPQIVRSGETSLEGMVRDMLRPMLAEWLDQHLPEIVERLVTAEIARIAGKKG